MRSIQLSLGLMVVVLILGYGCTQEINDDVKNIPLTLDIRRVDSSMYECSKALNLQSDIDIFTAYHKYLKDDRDFFYQLLGISQYRSSDIAFSSPSAIDSTLAKNLGPLLQDPNIFQLLDTIQHTFPERFPFEEEIVPALKRVKKFFPEAQFPAFRTHVNGYLPDLGYREVDQLISIPGYVSFGLHYFMGPDWPYYPVNIPQFLRKRFSPEYAGALLMSNVAEEFISPEGLDHSSTLLEVMVRAGIKQYFISQTLPNTADSILMMYTKDQMEWANSFEAHIYEELSTKFYESDIQIQRNYMSEKPYTTSLSLESAPRLGQFIGWKIVGAYMKRYPQKTLAELCEESDYTQIFREARYKP